MFDVTWCKEPLEIKYRMVDVDTLICVACQEFLSLVIDTDKKWQEELFKKAKRHASKNPYTKKVNDIDNKEKDNTEENDNNEENDNKIGKYNKYINVYKIMKDLDDISQLSVIHLDISLINEIVWNTKLTKEITQGTKYKLSDLSNDRNESCHSHKHETPDILFNRGIVYLDHLKKFVESVEKYENEAIPDDSIREAYSKKYKKLIKSLQKTLNNENNKYASTDSTDKTSEIKPVRITQREIISSKPKTIISTNTRSHKTSSIKNSTKTDSTSANEKKKSGLTVGGVSGSKKMRLGRVHTKKNDSSSTAEQP